MRAITIQGTHIHMCVCEIIKSKKNNFNRGQDIYKHSLYNQYSHVHIRIQ